MKITRTAGKVTKKAVASILKEKGLSPSTATPEEIQAALAEEDLGERKGKAYYRRQANKAVQPKTAAVTPMEGVSVEGGKKESAVAEPPSLMWVTFPAVASLTSAPDVLKLDLALHVAFLRARLSAWELPSAYVEHEVARFHQYHAAGGARREEVTVVVLSEFYDDAIEDTHLGVVLVDVTPSASSANGRT